MNQPDRKIAVVVVLGNDERMLSEFWLWEESPDNPDAVYLELHLPGRSLKATSEEGFFDALTLIREEIEPEGQRLVCYGCSKEVFPSPMARSMGSGEKAYRLRIGCPAKREDLVSIFDSGSDVNPATFSEQEQFYHEWLKSL